MANYIDRADLVGNRLTSAEMQLRFREMTGEEAYRVFTKMVNDMSAIDIVKCRECRYSRELNRNDRGENRYIDGCIWCANHCKGMLEDDFCSEGERRE